MCLPTHPLVSHMCIVFFLHKCTGHTFLADITPFTCEWLSLICHHLSLSSITVTRHCHLLSNPLLSLVVEPPLLNLPSNLLLPTIKPIVTRCRTIVCL